MSTPHNEAKLGEIAKTVIMPGDPLRAKYIAENFLDDYKLVNSVRGMYAYTGLYKGKEITIMAHGMGMPSVGIYSYELYKYYEVENIIRIGSCGSYKKDVNIYDVIIVKDAYSESSFAKTAFGYKNKSLPATKSLYNDLNKAAKKLKYPVINGRIHSSDVFYRGVGNAIESAGEKQNCLGVEMESFALFANAKFLNKNAACVLTVSDSLVTNEVTSAHERQVSFNKMMEIALESIK